MLTQDGFRMDPLYSLAQLEDLLPGAEVQFTACGCDYDCPPRGMGSCGWIAIAPHRAAYYLGRGPAPDERLRIVYPTAPAVVA